MKRMTTVDMAANGLNPTDEKEVLSCKSLAIGKCSQCRTPIFKGSVSHLGICHACAVVCQRCGSESLKLIAPWGAGTESCYPCAILECKARMVAVRKETDGILADLKKRKKALEGIYRDMVAGSRMLARKDRVAKKGKRQ